MRALELGRSGLGFGCMGMSEFYSGRDDAESPMMALVNA